MYQIYTTFGDLDWYPYMRPTKFLLTARLLVSWSIHKDNLDGSIGWEYQIRDPTGRIIE